MTTYDVDWKLEVGEAFVAKSQLEAIPFQELFARQTINPWVVVERYLAECPAGKGGLQKSYVTTTGSDKVIFNEIQLLTMGEAKELWLEKVLERDELDKTRRAIAKEWKITEGVPDTKHEAV